MKPKTLPNIRRSIVYDPIHPTDFINLNLVFYCEQCSHYSFQENRCTIGYNAELHVKKVQQEMYERCGRVAFCRFSEID